MICLCPLEGIIDVIGKKWALLIVNEIGNHGRIQYTELQEELHYISPISLADTLKRLQKENLISREIFHQIPPRVDYILTKEGLKLREAIIPLLKMGSVKKGNSSGILLIGSKFDRFEHISKV